MKHTKSLVKNEDKKIQLIVVGYAGSDATSFNVLRPFLDEFILLSVVEYRGRGRRRKEPFYRNCHEQVLDIAEQIKSLRTSELSYAILGYSMGAQVVYELFAQNLLPELPVCIFTAAHEPPDIDCAGKKFSIEDEAEFMEHVRIYGGMDERLLADPRFASIYISRMHADFSLLQSYQFSGKYHLFPVKLTMLYCEQDTPYKIVEGWTRFSGKEIAFYCMGENHFFFRTDTEAFCKVINDEIARTLREEI